MRIGVIGGGVVGTATARVFMEWADVRVFDVNPGRATHSEEETLKSDLVFICLPTPQSEDHTRADLRFLEGFFDHVKASSTCFVIKSTVPVGTTKRLRKQYGLDNLVHSPEFLTARCAVTDAHLPGRNIIGGPTCEALERLAKLYRTRFPGTPLYLMTSDESEMVKLMLNSFFAVKVAFFNEARTLADALEMDWDAVLAAVLSDGRIAHSHTRVPGPDSKRGFGGNCLPGYYKANVLGKGPTSLEDMKLRWDSGELIEIESTNANCKELTIKKVKSVTARPYSGEMIVLEVNGTKLVCTPDHFLPVIRNNELLVIRAKDIIGSDKVVIKCAQ